MHPRFTILLLLTLLVVSCSILKSTQPENENSVLPDKEYPIRSVLHWKSFMDWDAVTIEEAAGADQIVLPLSRVFSDASTGILQSLRLLNPNIQIIGYQPVLNVAALWPDTVYLRNTLPYELDYYYAVENDWACTTTGDTLMMWPGMTVLTPIENGNLNRDLIGKIVDCIELYKNGSANRLDGIMHDYFMFSIYINSLVAGRVEGEIDLDNDGIPMDRDENERELLVLWQKEYAREIRDRFGDDFIQIGNGRLPQDDGEMAAILNGIFYENFPANPWHYSDIEGVARLLQHHQPGYLGKAKGRTWSIVSNEINPGENMFCLLASMLADCFYAELHGSYVFDGWTLDIDAGKPLGPAIMETQSDSILMVKKIFERGEAYVSFGPSGRRHELNFVPNPPDE